MPKKKKNKLKLVTKTRKGKTRSLERAQAHNLLTPQVEAKGLDTIGKKSKAQSTKSGKQGAPLAQMHTSPEHVRANSSSPPELSIPHA